MPRPLREEERGGGGLCVCCRSGVSVRDALSCRVSMPCPKHTLRIGRVEPAVTAPHARVEWVAGVAGLARKLRAPRHCQWTVSPQAPRSLPAGVSLWLVRRAGLAPLTLLLPFFDLRTAGKNSAGEDSPAFWHKVHAGSLSRVSRHTTFSNAGEVRAGFERVVSLHRWLLVPTPSEHVQVPHTSHVRLEGGALVRV